MCVCEREREREKEGLNGLISAGASDTSNAVIWVDCRITLVGSEFTSSGVLIGKQPGGKSKSKSKSKSSSAESWALLVVHSLLLCFVLFSQVRARKTSLLLPIVHFCCCCCCCSLFSIDASRRRF